MSAITSGNLTSVVFEPRVPQSMRMCFSSPPGLNVRRKQSPSPWRYMRMRSLGRLTATGACGWVTAGFFLRAVATLGAGRVRLTRRAPGFDFLLALSGIVGLVDLAHN